MTGRTIVEKVLGAPSGDVVTVEPDRVMSHDNTAFVVRHFRETGRSRVWDPERIVVVFDHCVLTSMATGSPR